MERFYMTSCLIVPKQYNFRPLENEFSVFMQKFRSRYSTAPQKLLTESAGTGTRKLSEDIEP